MHRLCPASCCSFGRCSADFPWAGAVLHITSPFEKLDRPVASVFGHLSAFNVADELISSQLSSLLLPGGSYSVLHLGTEVVAKVLVALQCSCSSSSVGICGESLLENCSPLTADLST